MNNSTHHALPAVPKLNVNAIRDALKAHGGTLLDVTYEVQCRCEACGAEWSEEPSLEAPLQPHWWTCWRCRPTAEEGQ